MGLLGVAEAAAGRWVLAACGRGELEPVASDRAALPARTHSKHLVCDSAKHLARCLPLLWARCFAAAHQLPLTAWLPSCCASLQGGSRRPGLCCLH
jgi:hypothetical protein